jgi:hypothetical protein
LRKGYQQSLELSRFFRPETAVFIEFNKISFYKTKFNLYKTKFNFYRNGRSYYGKRAEMVLSVPVSPGGARYDAAVRIHKLGWPGTGDLFLHRLKMEK